MAGNNNSLFEQGARKAIAAPFRTLLFLVIAALVIVMGRMTIDGLLVGTDPAALVEAQENLRSELDYAAVMPSLFQPTQQRALAWALTTHNLIYVKTGLERSLVAAPPSLSETEKAFQRGMHATGSMWFGIMVGSQTLAVRAAILVSAIPLAILVYLMATVDGMVARHIRRVACGRESSTIYHRAKYMHVMAATVLTVAYLWWPTAIDPVPPLLFSISLFALLLRTQMQYYKKYV